MWLVNDHAAGICIQWNEVQKITGSDIWCGKTLAGLIAFDCQGTQQASLFNCMASANGPQRLDTTGGEEAPATGFNFIGTGTGTGVSNQSTMDHCSADGCGTAGIVIDNSLDAANQGYMQLLSCTAQTCGINLVMNNVSHAYINLHTEAHTGTYDVDLDTVNHCSFVASQLFQCCLRHQAGRG